MITSEEIRLQASIHDGFRPTSAGALLAFLSDMQASLNTDPKPLTERYHYLKKIGSGGMGDVLQALDRKTQRIVAIKTIRSIDRGPEGRDIAVERFLREARVLSQLHHANTVRFIDFGLEGSTPFIVMECLRGLPLNSLLKLRVPLPETFALHVALRIARSLSEAHKLGVVHRDIKPGNIMLVPTSEESILVKVLDFGVAKSCQPKAAQTLTEVGKFVGTTTYLAPECLVTHRQDGRRDLYSLGIVLYQMLAGQPPFVGNHPMKVLLAHHQTPPPPLDASIVCEETSRIVMRCIEKVPDARWPSADDLVEAIEQRLVRLREPIGGSKFVHDLPPHLLQGICVEQDDPTIVLAAALSSEPVVATSTGSANESRKGKPLTIAHVVGMACLCAAALLFWLLDRQPPEVPPPHAPRQEPWRPFASRR